MAMKSKPAAAKVNVNNLINEIRGVEADEERGRKFRAMITKTPMEGSIEAVHFLAALRWEDSARTARSRVHGQPGTARVLAVCRDEFGDASGMSLMRLRDRLSIRLNCEPAEVATMSLEDFLAAWKGGNATAVSKRPTRKPKRPAHRPPDTDTKSDAKIADTWLQKRNSGECRAYSDLAGVLKREVAEVKEAIDRDRKRRPEVWAANQRKPRRKKSSQGA